MNKKITIEDVLKHKPCPEWTEKRLKKALGNGKTLLEILGMEEITASDRIWCVSRFLPDKSNRAFAIWCARQCTPTLPEISTYIDQIEAYYNGKISQEELSTANWAAYSAANWAANSAAYCAAYWAADRATDRAANSAAYRAAYRAAYSAAYSAANWAAYWAERQKQIAKLKELIEL